MESVGILEAGVVNEFHAVISHPNMGPVDTGLFERVLFESSDISYFPVGTKIWDVLVAGKFFQSKNDARRNWGRGELREGWNEFRRIGKLNRSLFVLRLPDNFPAHSDDE